MYQLVIAEKPSVAQAIASVLGAKNKKDGYPFLSVGEPSFFIGSGQTGSFLQ